MPVSRVQRGRRQLRHRRRSASSLASGGQYVGAVAAASEFVTDGYRDHSSARRDLTNAKLVLDPSADTRITLIGNTQYQPETQDPLGLTRAQWSAEPARRRPGGVPVRHAQDDQPGAGRRRASTSASRDAVSLHVDALRRAPADPPVPRAHGHRRRRRRAASPISTATTAASACASPGAARALGRPADVIGRAPTSIVSTNGARASSTISAPWATCAATRTTTSTATTLYAQAEWSFAPRWSARSACARATCITRRDDHYVTAQNPDDSGSRRFADTSPVAGIVFHVDRRSQRRTRATARASRRRRSPSSPIGNGGSGLNFALQPARSRATEIGVKYRLARAPTRRRRRSSTSTRVTRSSSTRRPAAARLQERGRRRGAAALKPHGTAASTTASRRMSRSPGCARNSPKPSPPARRPCRCPSGARLPAVPSKQAYAELAWVPGRFHGLDTALEVQYVDKLYVNEAQHRCRAVVRGHELRASGFGQTSARATWQAFVRVNNLFDRNYAGSVIVGDGNGRFFEPAPGRNWFVGANVDVKLSERYAGRRAIALHDDGDRRALDHRCDGIRAVRVRLADAADSEEPPGMRADAFNLHKSIGLVHARADAVPARLAARASGRRRCPRCRAGRRALRKAHACGALRGADRRCRSPATWARCSAATRSSGSASRCRRGAANDAGDQGR